MNIKEKNIYINKINDILKPISNDKDLLEIIGELVIGCDLDFLGNLVKQGYEPSITSQWLEEECCYTEGYEWMGDISVGKLLKFIEEILNTADTERNISFKNYFMRLETEEELKENERPKDVVWFTKDKDVDLEKLIAFEIEY